MLAPFVRRTLSVLFVVACVAAAAVPAAALATSGGLPRIAQPRAVPLDLRTAIAPHAAQTPLAAEQRAFVPAGALLSATAEALAGDGTLRGTVATLGPAGLAPYAGLTVAWSLSGASGGAQTTTGADGTYLMGGAPEATGNGNVVVSGTRPTYPMVDFRLGHTGLTWPATGESAFDFTMVEAAGKVVPGGPWGDWTTGSISLYGDGPYEAMFCSNEFANDSYVPSGGLDAPMYVMPGRYDEGAAYWYANQGLELPYPLRVAPAPRNFTDSFFLDSTSGWLIAADSASLDVVSHIFRTTDGGRTWASSAGPTGVQLRGLDFADATLGCAVGALSYMQDSTRYETASILVSQDGGATWSERTSPVGAALNAVDFGDSLHGCAVGDDGAVVTTEDGGATWQAGASGVTGDLRDVCFIDATHGWACGGGGIVATSDGGATWSPAGPEGFAGSVTAIDTADGVHIAAAGTTLMAAGTLLCTTDGGAHWFYRPAADMDPASSVDFADALVGWVVTFNNGIAKTTDGGATWTKQRTPVPYARRLYSVAAIDATHAWAVGPSLVTDTVDGEVWSEPTLKVDQALAQRFSAAGKNGISGNPGSSVKLTLTQFPKGWVSLILGEPDYPASAVERQLGSYTSQGGTTERKTVTLPKTAKPGYFYWFAVGHKTGPLYLYMPFQVSLLKASDTSISAGGSIKLTGVVPTHGHWGSTPGKVKRVALFKSTVSATKGFRFVKHKRADGYGKFNLGTMSPSRTTWYIVLYPGDKTYWEDVTSTVKVTVR